MRTTLNIDKELIDYAVEATGEKTKRQSSQRGVEGVRPAQENRRVESLGRKDTAG